MVQDSFAYAQIVTALHRLQPDIIAAHTAKAGFLGRLAGRMLGIPCVFTPHGWSFVDRGNTKIKPCFRVLEKFCGSLGSAAISVCNREREVALEIGLFDSERFPVVHNGIPDSNLLADPARGPVVFTMIARFHPQKDHATLLRALAKLTHFPWTLHLAGAGPLLPQIKALCGSLGLDERVEFSGEHPDPARLLAESKVLVLSTFWEAFPICVLEGMRAGLPIVATDVGGISEAVLHESNGLLVPVSREDLLRDALRRLLQDAELRAKLGRNARSAFLANFTSDHMIGRTLKVYNAQVCRLRSAATGRPFPPASHAIQPRSKTLLGTQMHSP